GSVLVEMAGFEDRNFLPGPQLLWRHLAPMRAPVGGAMNQTIVAAGPDQINIKRRRSDRVNHAALDRDCRWLRAKLSYRFRNFKGLARKVRADLIPVSPPVFRLPQSVGREVEHVRIERRE